MPKRNEVIERIIVADSVGSRLSDYAVGRFESLPSRKSVKKAIKKGLLLVEGKVSETAHRVKIGEELSVVADDTVRPVYERKVPILYEDDYIAVVQKPADLPVSGNAFRTLQNALSFNLNPSPQKDALPVPRPVHRLDRLTGGVVVIAKTLSVAANLGHQFESRTVAKTYLAWVSGLIEMEKTIVEDIEEKEAITRIEPIKSLSHRWFSELTLVEAKPQTGRRNQIRIHLAQSGFPILGDLKFGGIKSGKGLFLFAQAISFHHPVSEDEMQIEAIVPKKFRLS
ncbi:MAG TPA: RluA family pseudouridine synthase [Cryomorphaceae bacterium]|nr:RluA family pseudouridine synthase [Cryomorphaceae bacterium]